MKKKEHIAVIAAGSALFFVATIALAVGMRGQSSWYHEPIMFPIRVAIWVGGNAHNPNIVAGNFAWAIECLVAGLLLDAAILFIVRRRRERRQRAL